MRKESVETYIGDNCYRVTLRDDDVIDIFKNGIFFTEAKWDPEYLMLQDIQEDFENDFDINTEVVTTLDDLILNEIIS